MKFTNEQMAKIRAYLYDFEQIIAACNVADMTNSEYNEIKRMAHEDLSEKHPYIANCILARRAQTSEHGKRFGPGMPDGNTVEEKIGHYIFGATGNMIKKYRNFESQINGADSSGADADDMTFLDLYSSLSDIYDILPPDIMIATIHGNKVGSVAPARQRARALGYEYEQLSHKDIAGGVNQGNSYAWWRVTKRPKKQAKGDGRQDDVSSLREEIASLRQILGKLAAKVA